MHIRKWVAILSVTAILFSTIFLTSVPSVAARTKRICNRTSCTATGLHRHGHTKYRTSCRYAVCNKTGCHKSGIHRHHRITYAGCGHGRNHHRHNEFHH